MDRHGPRGSCGKKALNRQILKVVYVQYEEIKRLQAAQCPTGCGASAVASKLQGRLSMSGIVTALENGSAKPGIKLVTSQDRQYTFRHNIEARSYKHCCSGKEISITYSECVF
jgi:hypothetical protein